jgi:ParB family chromosome partitioning protein
MAGRRTSLASLAGAKVDTVPGQSEPLLLTLPLDKLVPTRFNPRRNFDEDALRNFGLVLKNRQLQPAVVVSRAGYLKLWPDEAESVGDASYVIANGERRFRASKAVGLPTLDVVHAEDVARSRADFLDAVLSENNDRQDLDPIERAIGIETMVEQLGGADAVATHYGKTKGWVSQQRKLLKLTPELQALVSGGDLPVRVARDIAGLPPEEQAAAWAAEQRQREEAKTAPRSTRQLRAVPEPAPEPERFTAVNQSPPVHNPAPEAPLVASPAVPPAQAQEDPPPPVTAEPAVAPVPTTALTAVPEPRPEQAAGPTLMPWNDPEECAKTIISKLLPPERQKLVTLLLEQEKLEARLNLVEPRS